MFGAVRGSVSPATGAVPVEIVSAAVRTVKLATSYFLAENFCPRPRCALLTLKAIKRFGQGRLLYLICDDRNIFSASSSWAFHFGEAKSLSRAFSFSAFSLNSALFQSQFWMQYFT
jgi:hypothetical protein